MHIDLSFLTNTPWWQWVSLAALLIAFVLLTMVSRLMIKKKKEDADYFD